MFGLSAGLRGALLGAPWGPLKALLGQSWILQGRLRAPFDRLGALLGRLWALLGAAWVVFVFFVGASWPVLCCVTAQKADTLKMYVFPYDIDDYSLCGGVWGPSRSVFWVSWTVLEPPSEVFGASSPSRDQPRPS